MRLARGHANAIAAPALECPIAVSDLMCGDRGGGNYSSKPQASKSPIDLSCTVVFVLYRLIFVFVANGAYAMVQNLLY